MPVGAYCFVLGGLLLSFLLLLKFALYILICFSHLFSCFFALLILLGTGCGHVWTAWSFSQTVAFKMLVCFFVLPDVDVAGDLGFRFPGDKFQAVANSFEAHDKMVEAGYMLPFLGAIGTFELYSLWLLFKGWEQEVNRDAGDFFLGKQFLPKEPEKEKDMRLKELENGRLAMFAFSGIVTQAAITGKTWPFF